MISFCHRPKQIFWLGMLLQYQDLPEKKVEVQLSNFYGLNKKTRGVKREVKQRLIIHDSKFQPGRRFRSSLQEEVEEEVTISISETAPQLVYCGRPWSAHPPLSHTVFLWWGVNAHRLGRMLGDYIFKIKLCFRFSDKETCIMQTNVAVLRHAWNRCIL